MTDRADGATALWLEESEAAAAAVRAARALGVLARLEAGPVSPDQLAADCGIGARGSACLLGALGALGLAERRPDGTFTGAGPLPVWARGPDLWDGLAEALRTDLPVLAFDRAETAAAAYPDVVPLMAALVAGDSEEVADRLAPATRVLDVGAGAAPWSMALARRDPHCRCTAVDLPAVIGVTRRAVDQAGLAGQFELKAGDAFAMPLGSADYDVAIVANFCHLFDSEANGRLLGRVARAMRPGGTLAIVDLAPDGDEAGERWVALYALSLFLRTTAGRPHPLEAYAGWLRAAGLGPVARSRLPATGLSLITARRPRPGPRHRRQPVG